MERANYNWANYEDYVKSHDQDDQEMEYRPRYDANPDDDYDDDNEEEEDYSEGFQEQVEEQVEQQADYAADDYDDDNEEEDYAKGFQEQVEHETDYAADDSDESDFNGQFGWAEQGAPRQKGAICAAGHESVRGTGVRAGGRPQSRGRVWLRRGEGTRGH